MWHAAAAHTTSSFNNKLALQYVLSTLHRHITSKLLPQRWWRLLSVTNLNKARRKLILGGQWRNRSAPLICALQHAYVHKPLANKHATAQSGAADIVPSDTKRKRTPWRGQFA